MLTQTAAHAKAALKKFADRTRAVLCLRYFKTGKGQYGEGDIFLGVTVPQVRTVAKEFRDLPLREIERLLKDPIHECRLLALLILVRQYAETHDPNIVRFYIAKKACVNNWDLVDSSAHRILGASLLGTKDRSLLDRFAKSSHLWTQRIAVVSTFAFIAKGEFADSIRIAELLLRHPHDLMHKAVGWMLREVGKKNQRVLEKFLQKHATTMPRTALRYAIERFPEKKRKAYLAMR